MSLRHSILAYHEDVESAHFWHHIIKRFSLSDLTSGDDPREGSAREDSKGGGTVSTASNNKSSSLSKLGATFIPIAVFLGVCFVIFIILRRKCHRVYAPRTVAILAAPGLASPALPLGWFNWIKPFFKTPDSFVLHHGSLDGYLFLRYLKVLRTICIAGCCIVWPVLLPINGTGGRGNSELELLTMGNVANNQKFLAHAFVAWIFFGFVLYMIVRECIYYINLRQAYLSSPELSQRLSSRTMLLTCVPEPYLDERRLRRLYGESVRRVWIPRTAKTLVRLVKEREQTAMRLEKAQVLLIRKANAARNKQLKAERKHGIVHEPPTHGIMMPDRQTEMEKGAEQCGQQTISENALSDVTPPPSPSIIGIDDDEPGSSGRVSPISRADREAVDYQLEDPGSEGDKKLLEPVLSRPSSQPIDASQPSVAQEPTLIDPEEYKHPYGLNSTLPDLRGSVAAQWIPASARPYHRPLGNYFRRQDTIKWCRTRLKQLNLQIYKLRRGIRGGTEKSAVSLPVAFIEFHTQEAAQAAHQVVAHHRPLQMSPRLLGVRPDEVVWSALRMSWWERIIRKTLVTALIIAAIIFWSIPCAVIGVISNVETLSRVPFLTWLTKLPKPILGFLEGFVPAIALSLWMAAVPGMLRGLAAQAGVPSLVLVERFVQNAYFAFQIVQVFLITTITSAASGALTKILANPMTAKDLLAENLPKASNFYLSYILIQCLANGAFGLLHVFELFRHHILSRVSALPRARFRIWRRMRVIHYGGVYPVFTNMGVIALCYACIAPLVLVFAAGGMTFVHLVWKYNTIYVFDSSLDSKGIFYPKGLTQLIVGLYLAEICLIGLFALNFAFGPLLLMVLFALFTVVVHLAINDAIAPLIQNLPQTMEVEAEIQEEVQAGAAGASEDTQLHGAANDYYDTEQTYGDEGDQIEEEAEEVESEDEHGPVTGTRGLEGASSVQAAALQWLRGMSKEKMNSEIDSAGLSSFATKLSTYNPLSSSNPNFLSKWLHPEVYEDFLALRATLKLSSPQEEPDWPLPDDHQQERAAEYRPPEMWLPKPTIWLPQDEARVSRQEVAHNTKSIPTSDEAAWLDENGKILVELEAAPISIPTQLL